MLKKINRVLKLVGLNLVRAKRRKVAKAIPEGTVPLSDYQGECEWQSTPPRPPYTVEELMKCGLEAKCNQPHPFNDGITHFVGDDCPGGHLGGPVGCDDHKMTRVEQPNSDNKISGPTS